MFGCIGCDGRSVGHGAKEKEKKSVGIIGIVCLLGSGWMCGPWCWKRCHFHCCCLVLQQALGAGPALMSPVWEYTRPGQAAEYLYEEKCWKLDFSANMVKLEQGLCLAL